MTARETGLYYLQSRYYNPTWGRFLNADAYTSTGQGMLGNNMFAYCVNNPVVYYDPSGCYSRCRLDRVGTDYCAGGGCSSGVSNDSAKKSQKEPRANEANMRAFFGIGANDALPELEEGCMVFLENTWTFTIGSTAFVHGTAVVMDYDRYCLYTFSGVSRGVSGIVYDYCETMGYVYGVKNIEDYKGCFLGCSFNELANVSGGAVATNDVYAVITRGQGFLSPGAGVTFTYYNTPYSDWIYGAPTIRWHAPMYQVYPYDSNIHM